PLSHSLTLTHSLSPLPVSLSSPCLSPCLSLLSLSSPCVSLSSPCLSLLSLSLFPHPVSHPVSLSLSLTLSLSFSLFLSLPLFLSLSLSLSSSLPFAPLSMALQRTCELTVTWSNSSHTCVFDMVTQGVCCVCLSWGLKVSVVCVCVRCVCLTW